MMYSKHQVLGYAKFAAKRLGMPYATVEAFVTAMDWVIHLRSPEEAEEHYLGGESDDRG